MLFKVPFHLNKIIHFQQQKNILLFQPDNRQVKIYLELKKNYLKVKS